MRASFVISAALLYSLPCMAKPPHIRELLDTKRPAVVAAVETTFLLDMVQTLDIKRWPQAREVNPILGQHPSDLRVISYFAASGVAYAIAYEALPPKWAFLLSVGVAAMEASVIGWNAANGAQFRF